MTKIFFVFIITLLQGICYAQVTLEWQMRYDGTLSAQDAGNSVVVNPAGNICVAGYTYSANGNLDYLVLEYNQQGILLWSATYNGTGDSADVAVGVATDNSGNIYVTGTSGGSGTYRDFVTVKYNSIGVQQWIQRYNGPGNGLDNATGIITDNAGNIYVIGYSRILGTFEDYVTIKYTSSGSQEWVQRYNGPGGYGDWARGIDLDNSGSIYVTGESVGSGTSIDYCTVKYNSGGALQWAARYHGTGNYYDFATAVAVDDSGNAYVTGYTFSGAATEQDYGTIKYNSGGVQQWIAIYNAPANSWEQPYYIALDNSGNVFVTGFAVGANSGTDYCTVKYSNSGEEKWVKVYNGPGNYVDEPTGLAVDGYGNVYVTGPSYGNGTSYDICTIKYDNSGNILWTERFNNQSNTTDRCYDIALDGNLNIFLTGYSFFSASNNDCVTLKYSQGTVSIIPSENIPGEFRLYQNYPNPFNPTTKIKFDISKKPVEQTFLFVSLKIYNILGQEVTTLVNNNMKPGTYEIEFDGNSISGGIYYYTLKSGQYVESKKMILIK